MALDGAPSRTGVPGGRTREPSGTDPHGLPDPHAAPPVQPVQPTGPGEPAEPAEPLTARSSALRRSAIAGGTVLAAQLVAFGSWTVGWAGLLGVAAFLVLAFLLWIDRPTPQLRQGTGGLFVAAAVTMVSGTALLLSSRTAWWVALIITVLLCPVLLVLQKPLSRGLGTLFARHEAEAQTAVSAGLANAALATGYYMDAGGMPVLRAIGLGLLTWGALAAGLTPLLPGRSRPPVPEQA
ncbi:hypothetical protein [Kitasatospora sp. NPDC051914]|uniref:hypothetical protein n=1 Tax=Kitasatospora sp. NPDC051914 TaxID=3154945 RepID=UPI0034215CA4